MTQTVLVIDDSQDIHDMLAVRLRPEGVRLVHVIEAENGMDCAVETRPDLILLDVDMPNMTGFEVCQRLKADMRTSDIPIIFLTGASEVHAKVQGFDLGAVDYVTKPFQPAELRARVRAALRTKRYHDLLSARAQLDGLTGLWNRAYFDRRIHEEMLAVQRYGRVVSLVLMDLDHFKRLNDSYGHPFGDLVLQRVGEVLLATLREVDAPCRYGGEEFALVLTETALPGALTAVRRIREQLEAIRLVQKGEPVSIRASFGVASTEGMSPPTTTTVEKLVRLADEALYAVKGEGRDGVRCAAPAAS